MCLRPTLAGWALLATLVGTLHFPVDVAGQLISPGELSAVHQDLTGMGKCTRCHQLRSRGIDPPRCLQCHEALGRRIESKQGFHGRLEEGDCGVCHKEHLGTDFALIRMEPDTFFHGSTGYPLEGAHVEVECRECHSAGRLTDPAVLQEHSATGTLDRTYLGLSPVCASCHEAQDPHDGQFPNQDCRECHEQDSWEDAGSFDHARTSYPLEGRHRTVDCTGCHIPEQASGGVELIRYRPVEARDCRFCHEDPHRGRIRTPCASCHDPSGWNQVNRGAVERGFDHAATDFPLVGAHGDAECRACHTPSGSMGSQTVLRFREVAGTTGYPAPEFTSCQSCHLDFHDGIFDQPSCDGCHTSDSWAPPDYSLARHRMDRRFRLSGAHAVTPCSSCHEVQEGGVRSLVFRFPDPQSCQVCHGADDPHEGAFQVEGCDLCHGDVDFRMDEFDHGLLSQAGWRGSCIGCHEEADPHGDQFLDRDCAQCHETGSFAVPDFDHSITHFPLGGAHEQVPCSGCHRTEMGPRGTPMVRYRPLETECAACHGGGQ